MVRLNSCDADWPLLSVTFMVNLKVPFWVGVPASWLLLSFGANGDRSASPGGSSPEATDQVYGATPPLRKKFCAYETPTVPGDSVDPLAGRTTFSGSGGFTRVLLNAPRGGRAGFFLRPFFPPRGD